MLKMVVADGDRIYSTATKGSAIARLLKLPYAIASNVCDSSLVLVVLIFISVSKIIETHYKSSEA